MHYCFHMLSFYSLIRALLQNPAVAVKGYKRKFLELQISDI